MWKWLFSVQLEQSRHNFFLPHGWKAAIKIWWWRFNEGHSVQSKTLRGQDIKALPPSASSTKGHKCTGCLYLPNSPFGWSQGKEKHCTDSVPLSAMPHHVNLFCIDRQYSRSWIYCALGATLLWKGVRTRTNIALYMSDIPYQVITETISVNGRSRTLHWVTQLIKKASDSHWQCIDSLSTTLG